MQQRRTRQHTTGFTLIELLVAMVIIGLLATIGLGSFMSSQAKARDGRRKADLANIAKSLEYYYNDKGTYPEANATGQILGCGTTGTTACTWGGAFAQGSTVYMQILPTDPSGGKQYYYMRPSASTYYIYAGLENTRDTVSIITPSQSETDCGTAAGAQTCNYGVSSTNASP